MIIKITYKGIMSDTETYKLSKVDKECSSYEIKDPYFKFVYKDKKGFHTLIIPWDNIKNIEIIREEDEDNLH